MRRAVVGAALATSLLTTVVYAATHSIPKKEIDAQQIYWGNALGFEKAGEVAFDAILQATPEYKELKDRKVKQGTGRYSILLSQATDRALRAIIKFGQSTDFDLIAAEGYLGKLSTPIPTENVTDRIIEQMNG